MRFALPIVASKIVPVVMARLSANGASIVSSGPTETTTIAFTSIPAVRSELQKHWRARF